MGWKIMSKRISAATRKTYANSHTRLGWDWPLESKRDYRIAQGDPRICFLRLPVVKRVKGVTTAFTELMGGETGPLFHSGIGHKN